MDDYVSLSCPNCGAKLEITEDIDKFACGHCRNEIVVRRGGGIISLEPVARDISQIRGGVDRTAAELAIPRLEKKISELEVEEYDLKNIVNQRRENLSIPVKERSGEDYLRAKLTRVVVVTVLFLVISFFIMNRGSGYTSFNTGLVIFFVIIILLIAGYFVYIGLDKIAEDKEVYELEMKDYNNDLAEVNKLEARDLDTITKLRDEIIQNKQKLNHNQEIVDGV